MNSGDSLVQLLEREDQDFWKRHASEIACEKPWWINKAQPLSYSANDLSADIPSLLTAPGAATNRQQVRHAPVSMMRSVSAIMPHQHRYGNGILPAKRPHQPGVAMASSASFTPPTTIPTYSLTHATNASLPPRTLDAHVYDPEVYIEKFIPSDHTATAIDSVRQCFGLNSTSTPTTQYSSYFAHDHSTMPPNLSNLAVIPLVSRSTSMSSQPSLLSLASSEPMSRQSSYASSMTDDPGLLRVESSTSHCPPSSDVFSFASFQDDSFGIDASMFSSIATERPGNSMPIPDSLDNNLGRSVQWASAVDIGDVGQALPISSSFPSTSWDAQAPASFAHALNITSAQGNDLQRQDSQQSYSSTTSSTSSSSTNDKSFQRRRKHIENAKQNIAPKSLPDGPKSTSATKSGNHLRAPEPHDSTRRKEAITKTPYTRPQHPKLFCNLCSDHPSGFRGDHELRRHYDRAHASTRRVWICVEPAGGPTSSKEEWWPSRPLSICKQCKQRKPYNVYYNAAAHLRRSHFNPRKRGRKARGEVRESRAGKAGGDWPPIEWLKSHGWLQEIELPATAANASPKLSSQADSTVVAAVSEEDEEDDDEEVEGDADLDFAAQTLSFSSAYQLSGQSATDWDLGYQNPVDAAQPFTMAQPAYQAPALAHTLSAPPIMMAGVGSLFDAGMIFNEIHDIHDNGGCIDGLVY